MDGFINLFEKLSKDLKIQISFIIAGLLIPSLLYYVLNFPNEFYALDIIKIIFTCVGINFIIMFTLLCIIIILKSLIYFHRRKLVDRLKESLENSLHDLNARNYALNNMLDSKKDDLANDDLEILDDLDLAKLASDLDKDVIKLTKQYTLFNDYINDFTDLGMYLFYSAASYIVAISFNSMLNLLFLIKKEFKLDDIVKEVRINLIIFALITLFYFIKEDKLKIKALKEKICQD